MIAYYKTEVPFLRILISYVCGISLAIYFQFSSSSLWQFLFAMCISTVLLIKLYLKKNKLLSDTPLIGLLIYSCVFISGVLFVIQHSELNYPTHFSKLSANYHIVTVLETPKVKSDIARFKVKVDENTSDQGRLKTSGNLLIAMRFDTLQPMTIKYGDVLLIKSKYTVTEPPYNPAEFNYKRYLSYKQVYHQSFIHIKQSVLIGEDNGNYLQAAAIKFREQQVEKFKRYIPTLASQSVAATLILGERTDISKEILEAYSKTGTMHILSVSGMHVAIVVILLNLLFSFLNKNTLVRIIKSFMMIVLIWLYAFITGLAPSVERAAIMLSFILIAEAFNKKTNSFNILALAGLIILIRNPYNLMDVGFQLSFIAVGGLLYIQPIIHQWFEPENMVFKFAWSCISVSLAAQIATAPISLYYFHQFPLYFLISNLFIAIPAIMMMYGGLALLTFSFVDVLAKILGIALDYLIRFTNQVLIHIEGIDYSTVSQIWMSKIEIVIFYAAIILFCLALTSVKHLKSALFTVAFLLMIRSWNHYVHLRQKQVMYFSLRKNTAIAFINGKEALLLTDLKADDYTYSFSVKPYLDSCLIETVHVINPSTNSSKLVKFDDYRLQIFVEAPTNKSLNLNNAVLLAGDKKYTVQGLADFKQDLFLDGKNRDFINQLMVHDLQNLGLHPYILKRNRAVEIKLN